MERPPSLPAGPAVEESEELFCYGHPDTPTRLRCSRCERPICGRCAIPASVGQHCPECVAEARRSAPRIRSAIAAQAPGVVAIMAVNIGFFVFQQLVPTLTPQLGMSPRAIASGEWWRLLTPMVLHAGGFHILMNSLILWIYGPRVEEAFGTAGFLVIYVISGFIGSVASYTFSSPFILGVGASGAIFGIAGVLLVYLYRRRTQALAYAEMRNVMFFIGINLLLGFALPQIDYWAHIGGLLGGIALAIGFDARRTGAPLVQTATALAVTAAGVAVLFYRSGQLGGSPFG